MKKNRLERKNNFSLDGTTGRRIKEEKRRETIQEKNIREYKELQEKVSKYNPLPKRGAEVSRLISTVDKHSNFINCSQKYFNRGKYKGIFLKDTPQNYLIWVAESVNLNDSELKLIRKFIKK